jgi:LuxR family maltose regulon positive regulatory protein
MLAVVYQKQAKTEQASAAAEQAVTLAHPGNFIRPFLELGPPMVEILRHLRRKKVAQDFIERILVAFEKQSQARVPQSESAPQAPPPTAQPSRALWEDLTQRELDVLTCLEKGMSNKEIGAELFLSALTVKKHLYNIFQKLNVHTRLEAVKKARESGLLARD